jgi:hypothetical protein
MGLRNDPRTDPITTPMGSANALGGIEMTGSRWFRAPPPRACDDPSTGLEMWLRDLQSPPLRPCDDPSASVQMMAP